MAKKDLGGMFGGNNPADLVRKHGAAMGLDDASSSVIIAGMDATVMPMCLGNPFDEDEQACDDFDLHMYIIDGSGSMDVVADLVREGFNDVIMPGLLEGALEQVGAIRFNGIVFNDNIRPLFGQDQWQKLTAQFPRLTTSNYSAGGLTSLNRAVMAGAIALASHCVTVKEETGTAPRGKLICISDGKNRVDARLTPQNVVAEAEVAMVLGKFDPRLISTIFYGWETGEVVDFREIAKTLGFRDIKELKRQPGETDEALRRRIRHDLQVFSQKLVRASVNKVAAPDPSGSTGFWN
jgi:hypothetical protein